MATLETSSGALSEETFDYKCTALCWKKKMVQEAVRACPDCKKYFCPSCLEVHDDMLHDHNTVEPSALFFCQPTKMPTEQCKKHAGKTIDVWCVQHDTVGCVTCAFFEHRSCEDVKDIQIDIKEIFKQEEFDLAKILLKSSLEYLKGRQRFINGEKENLTIEKNKQLSEVEEFARNLISTIEDLVKKTKDEIYSKFKEIEDDIQKVADDCKHHEENIRRCMKQFESCTDNAIKMFITMKNARQTIALADRNCRDPVIGDCTVIFKNDPSIGQNLTGLLSLGTSSKVLRKYELIKKEEINVTMSDDSDACNIEGSCLLPDGSVVVTDRHNKKLKHVDISSSSVIDSCTVPGSPYGVCCVGQELVVALWEEKIQFVTLGRRLTLSRIIDVDHNCHGIDYHNGELYVSDKSKTVYVYNMMWSLLRKLTNFTSHDCIYIAVSRNGERVFIACPWDGLVCIDLHGNPSFTHRNEKIRCCHGVCPDNRFSLFVCGYNSNNVVQVSESGEEVGEIVNSSDGVCNPQSMCFDPSQQRLVVAQNSSNVLVIDLKLIH